MTFAQAKSLYEGAEVWVKMYANRVGYVVGSPYADPTDTLVKTMRVDVIVENVGLVMGIPHTELK